MDRRKPGEDAAKFKARDVFGAEGGRELSAEAQRAVDMLHLLAGKAASDRFDGALDTRDGAKGYYEVAGVLADFYWAAANFDRGMEGELTKRWEALRKVADGLKQTAPGIAEALTHLAEVVGANPAFIPLGDRGDVSRAFRDLQIAIQETTGMLVGESDTARQMKAVVKVGK